MARRSDHTLEQKRDLALDAATALAAQGGLRAVTARAVAERMGYTIGTLYNIYDNLDELIARANARTLDDLYAALTATPAGETAEEQLRELARRYVAFIAHNPGRWGAVIEAPSTRDLPLADWYGEKVERPLALAERAIAGYFRPDDDPAERAALRRHARVLWSALHGICILAAQGGMHREDSVDSLIDALIEAYLPGLAARRAPAL